MQTVFIFLFVLIVQTSAIRAQGTFIYDQQSADESTGGGVTGNIQANQPIGQSFIPTLDTVGFIRLFIGVPSGSAFLVNLRTDSITGPILATSDELIFGSNFVGYTNFFFASPVGVSPGTTYYFQPVIQSQSGGGVIVGYQYGYSGGTAFVQGVANPNSDLWFREGIYVVPEPSSWALLVGSGALFYVRRKKIKNDRNH